MSLLIGIRRGDTTPISYHSRSCIPPWCNTSLPSKSNCPWNATYGSICLWTIFALLVWKITSVL